MVIPDSLIFEYIGLTNPMRYVLVLQKYDNHTFRWLLTTMCGS